MVTCFIGPAAKNLENPFALVVDTRLTTNLTMNPSTFPVDVFCPDARHAVSWVTTEEVGGADDGHPVKNIIIQYRMSEEFVPIKLMKTSTNKTKLLIAMNEEKTPYIDKNDWLESRIKTNSRARKLMTIENASEIAKWFIQQDGIFEKIAKDIKKETGEKFTFKCRETRYMKRANNSSKGKEYILIEHDYPSGEGHYGMVVADHTKKIINLYDSMRATNDVFKTPLKKVYPRPYKLIDPGLFGNKGIPYDPQPTGGFLPKLNEYKRTSVPKNKREGAYMIAQFDEFSQHHFCYIESFVAMMKDLGLTKGGPKDPRLRLPWIKKVLWGLILKNLPLSKRTGPEWNYLNKYFKYYMKTRDSKNNLLEIVDGQYQIPPNDNIVKYDIGKIDLTNEITTKWTYAQIMKWVN